MTTHFNNALLPNYSGAVKNNVSNGYNDLVGNGNNNSFSNYAKMFSDSPDLQEKYKNYYNQYGTAKGFFDTGSGDNIPMFEELDPMQIGGQLIYPWQSGYTPGAMNNISARATPTVDRNLNLDFIDGPEVPTLEADKPTVGSTSEIYAPLSDNVIELEADKPAVNTTSELYDPVSDDPLSDDADVTSDDLNQTVLDQLEKALAGEGLPGTSTAASEMRETLAAFSKDVRAKAGLGTGQRGGFGQGTQFGAANRAQQNIMSQLGTTERNIAGLKAADAREALGTARDVFESDRTFEEGQRTFDESMGLTREQFDHLVSSGNLDRIERIGKDNPVLTSVITDIIMEKEGVEFTPEQVTELEDYYKEKAERQETLDEIDDLILAALPESISKMIKSINDPTTTEKTENKVMSDVFGPADEDGNFDPDYEIDSATISEWDVKDWESAQDDPATWNKIKETFPKTSFKTYTSYSDLKDGGFVADEYITTERKANSTATGSTTSDKNKDAAGAGNGSIVMIDGSPHRIVKIIEMSNYWAYPDEFYTTVFYQDLTKEPDEEGYMTSKKVNRR